MEIDAASLEQYRLKLRYKVCYHLGGFCPDVDDVVQETLTRGVSAMKDKKIQKPENLGAFLSGVCNNVIFEYRRRIWREAPPESDGPPDTGSVAPEAEMLELQDAISAALSQMSERDCQILRAFFLQERDKEEICHATGLSDAQFRVALFRAKDRFRKIYQQSVKREPPGGH